MAKNQLNKLNKETKKSAGALFIPAGLFIGMGFGFLTNHFVSWMMLGLGFGFLLFALTIILKK
ncbi:MAG: hypothetical protein V1663_00320 [archaeon]